MKYRIRIFFLIFTLGVLLHPHTLFAELKKHVDIKPFVPLVMARGNGYVAQAHGLHSLWYNPAGLAYQKLQHDRNLLEITPFMMSIQGHDGGEELNIPGSRSRVSLYGGITLPFNKLLINQSNKEKARKFAGHSLGTALAIVSDAHGIAGLQQPVTFLMQSVELMLGYAYKHNLHLKMLDRNSLDPIQVRLGFALRPIMRADVSLGQVEPITADTFTEFTRDQQAWDKMMLTFATIGENTVGIYGAGIGFDVGTQIEWENIVIGAAVRDIYTYLLSSEYTEDQTWEIITDDYYIIPMSVDVGIAYALELRAIKSYFIPSVYMQVTDVFSNTNSDELEKDSLIKYFHTGLNFSVLPPFFDVQVGLNQGYITLGMSADIYWFDISYVIYMVEENTIIREDKLHGMGFEMGVRW